MYLLKATQELIQQVESQEQELAEVKQNMINMTTELQQIKQTLGLT